MVITAGGLCAFVQTNVMPPAAGKIDIRTQVLREGALSFKLGTELERASPVPVLSTADHSGGGCLEKKVRTYPLKHMFIQPKITQLMVFSTLN